MKFSRKKQKNMRGKGVSTQIGGVHKEKKPHIEVR